MLAESYTNSICITKSVLAALGAVVIVVMLFEFQKRLETDLLSLKKEWNLDEKKSNMLLYRTIGMTLWPFVFLQLIPPPEQSLKMTLPFLWPFCMWVLDAYLIAHGTSISDSTVAMMRVEPSTICSMSFALYGLVGANLAQENSQVFMYAILAIIAFAFPNHNLEPGSKEEQIIEAFQRTITTFCTGLMFAGVVLNSKKMITSED